MLKLLLFLLFIIVLEVLSFQTEAEADRKHMESSEYLINILLVESTNKAWFESLSPRSKLMDYIFTFFYRNINPWMQKIRLKSNWLRRLIY